MSQYDKNVKKKTFKINYNTWFLVVPHKRIASSKYLAKNYEQFRISNMCDANTNPFSPPNSAPKNFA